MERPPSSILTAFHHNIRARSPEQVPDHRPQAHRPNAERVDHRVPEVATIQRVTCCVAALSARQR
jgi:hypothetical protein